MQEMRCKKENVGTHSTRIPSIGKGKDADLGHFQDGSGINKKGETEQDHGPLLGGWAPK